MCTGDHSLNALIALGTSVSHVMPELGVGVELGHSHGKFGLLLQRSHVCFCSKLVL
jgi:hypothetical protein